MIYAAAYQKHAFEVKLYNNQSLIKLFQEKVNLLTNHTNNTQIPKCQTSQTFHYTRRITPKLIKYTSLRCQCPSPRHSATATELLA